MNRILSLIAVVALGIFVGVAIAVQRSGVMTPGNNNIIGQQLVEIIRMEQGIDQRLSAIEEQQKKMLAIFESAQKAYEKLAQQPSAPAAAPQQPPSEDYSKVYDIPQGRSYVHGKKEARVTIVEFADFQCPFCHRFHSPVQEVLKAYPNDVKYIIKNFPLPFHPQARPAAKAALAAGEQGKYYAMVDLLFADPGNVDESKFEELAKKLGLNVKQFMRDYKEKDAQWESILADDLALVDKADVRGTPTFYINGKKTRARDLNAFKTEIEQILGQKK